MSKVSENLRAAIQSLTPREINEFWDGELEIYHAKLPDCPEEDLLKIQAGVKVIRDLRTRFHQIHKEK